MPNRREFLRAAAQWAGAAGTWVGSQQAIARALAIEPNPGSSFFDAEHVVILMQENRSFDHAFGTLSGVRGFNDPRAIRLPNGNPVWLQSNAKGETYSPFRLDLKNSKATWMGCLPHNWTDQVDARNNGKFDKWLDAKAPGTKAYAHMPLTMGYYSRQDIPFYYALADAFTICDQHFCSTLTGTTPNRLHLWTGTIRARQSADAKANVLNSDVDHGHWASWTTFPERLEDQGISWKCYQNELTVESGLSQAEDDWLANFGDNPLEYFTQYYVRHAEPHRRYVAKRVQELPGEIAKLKDQLAKAPAPKDAKRLAELTAELKKYEQERNEFTPEHFAQLPAKAKSLFARAFDTNCVDPDYRSLTTIKYRDGERERSMQVPKGDMLHQFRKDVREGKLPTVSWLTASANFSDHPSCAWFGAWYISEVMNILTSNPEVWGKTIFILTYDENDGYFDHVPPFVAPHPSRPETGKVTKGIDTSLEYVELEQDMRTKPKSQARDSAMGLGYRVPMIIASPWTRGGCVCSQVFDHTSSIQFLEKFLSRKTGKNIHEPNINSWRRTVCGDLTSAFQAPDMDQPILPFHQRDQFVEGIHRAQFQPLPAGFHQLSDAEVQAIRNNPRDSKWMPRQELGQRRSAPLPYELFANCVCDSKNGMLTLRLEAKNDRFGLRSAGSPFNVYVIQPNGAFVVRNYAVEAGATLEDTWELSSFADGKFHLRVDGPNGFFREFRGTANDPMIDVVAVPQSAIGVGTTDDFCLSLVNHQEKEQGIVITDRSYNSVPQQSTVASKKQKNIVVDTTKSHGWYDFSLTLPDVANFERRFAGRIETGLWSFSDPAME